MSIADLTPTEFANLVRNGAARKTQVKSGNAPATLRDGMQGPGMNLSAAEKDGQPVIPVDAHVRLASATANDGTRILRRGYSFTDGVDESLGELEAGLFFICFQQDPAEQFVSIQRRLGQFDALNEYVKHVGSAVFAVPPGARRGGYVGEALFA